LRPAVSTTARWVGQRTWGTNLEVHDVPGHRIGLLSEPRVGPVATRIMQVIDQSTR
jgi:hypothetical protein